jgi:hypothetical protein
VDVDVDVCGRVWTCVDVLGAGVGKRRNLYLYLFETLVNAKNECLV